VLDALAHEYFSELKASPEHAAPQQRPEQLFNWSFEEQPTPLAELQVASVACLRCRSRLRGWCAHDGRN